MDEIKLGKYKHYKGKQYEVIGLARHSETLEQLVIYKALYSSEEFGNNALWVRPKKCFSKLLLLMGKMFRVLSILDRAEFLSIQKNTCV